MRSGRYIKLACFPKTGYNSKGMTTNTSAQRIASRLEESARLKLEIARGQAVEIERIARLIIDSLRSGGKLVICGNGGSAADAQHIAGELVAKFLLERKALPAIALTTNTSILTALGNDCGYETVFARQVEALVNEGDVVLGLSTSGNSANVVQALKAAKARRATTIALTGEGGGAVATVADITLKVPSRSVPRIQEAHIVIGHIVCEMVEEALAGEG